MNVGEYGVIFYFSTGFDMSAWTGFKLTFTLPDGVTQLLKTNPAVTLGTVNVMTDNGLFIANKYVKYTTIQGDISQAGTWMCRCTYDDPAQHLISDIGVFIINI